MTLMQRDREMKEEGMELSLSIVKLYLKGYSVIDIANKLQLDTKIVVKCISNFESK